MPSSSGETISIYSPNDDSLVTDKVQVASEQDVDKAVAAAKKALPAWRDMAGHKRAAIMLKFADLLEKNVEKLAQLESAAMGQPVWFVSRAVPPMLTLGLCILGLRSEEDDSGARCSLEILRGLCRQGGRRELPSR